MDQRPRDRDRGGVHRRRAHRPVRSTAPGERTGGRCRGVRGIPDDRERAKHGYLYDWDDLAFATRQAFERGRQRPSCTGTS